MGTSYNTWRRIRGATTTSYIWFLLLPLGYEKYNDFWYGQLKEIVEGISYIHSLDVVHGDIRGVS
jgi:hypothetical protein